MKKQILTAIITLFGIMAYSQVGINTTTPAATLDIIAKNPTGTTTIAEGLIIPRVDRERAASMTSVTTSTLVYVNSIATGTATGIATNINAIGYYYYDGSFWQKLGSGTPSPYENIKGNVNSLSTATSTYTVAAGDYIIVTNATGGTGVTVTFSGTGFTAADAGKTVWLFNDNATTANTISGIQANSVIVNNAGRGIPFVWTGTKWITLGK